MTDATSTDDTHGTSTHGTSTHGTSTTDAERPDLNEVHLVGRVSKDAREVVLPSGDTLVTFRVVVRRDGRGRSGRTTVDAIECVARTAAARRKARSLVADLVVDVRGPLRRRFRRTATGAVSSVEVEVTSLSRVRGSAG